MCPLLGVEVDDRSSLLQYLHNLFQRLVFSEGRGPDLMRDELNFALRRTNSYILFNLRNGILEREKLGDIERRGIADTRALFSLLLKYVL